MLKNIEKLENWKIEDLTNLVFFQEGPGVRNNQYTDSGVKLLNVANLKEGNIYLDNTDRYISEEEAYGKYSHFLVDEGDLIIASSGIKVEYFDKKMGFAKKEHLPLCMNTSTIRFKALDDKILDIKYFAYFLKSVYFKKQIGRLITGSAQLNFGPTHLKQIKVILPPIDTQNRIVEILDKAQYLIDKKKERIDLLDELVKSRFIEMFGNPVSNPKGWEKKRLSDECNIITGNTPSRKVEEYYGDYIEWIKSDNITGASIYLSKAKECLSEEGLKVGRFIDKNSILMTCIAGSKKCIGNVAINDRKVAFNQQINGIEPLENDVYFMLEQFKLSQYYIQSTINMSLKGILSKGQLSELEFIFPPIEKQKEFSKFFKKVIFIEEKMKNSLKELEDTFYSLMQNAFNGSL